MNADAADTPDLDDVLVPEESATPDHREHAKTPKHLNDEELARRTQEERVEAGVEDYDADSAPSADE